MRSANNTRIFAFITNRCNNACRYCFVYNENCQIEDVSLEQFKKLCSFGIDKYQYITFIGGEPLLHPQLYDLMQCALDNGYILSVSTSGIEKYDETTEKIFSLPIDDVTLSLDSADESINDWLRGKGSFRRIVDTACYLKQKNIPFRITATVCNYNKDGIFDHADFTRALGAFQLDLHVMSQQGRAKNRTNLSLSPQDWYSIRQELDRKCYPYPFCVSYPLIWYKNDEFRELDNYCDGSVKHRLSIMSNCNCYYCTLAIGLDGFKVDFDRDSIEIGSSRYRKQSNLCEAERRINTQDNGFNYICRFIKRRTNFIK